MLRRHAIGLAAAGPLLFGKVLTGLGLKRPPEAWRSLLGSALRGEPSKFALSAFGLRVPAAELPARFHAFLRSEPEAAYALTHSAVDTRRHAHDTIDLVVQHFDADGTLSHLDAHLDPARPSDLSHKDQCVIHALVLHAYRETAHLPESVRPLALLRRAGQHRHLPLETYQERLVKAVCLSVEPMDAARRFELPHFAERRGLGHNVYTFAARTAGDTADVWGIAHHVGADGVPFQELFTRLERAWGTDPVEFPAAGTVYPARVGHHPGEREVYESLSFHDFAPLLRLRKKVNADLGLDVPVGAFFLWVLAREPEFAGVRFASTVDVPATPDRERAVDLVPRRPADFGDDLAAYVRSYLDGVAASRARRSPVQRAGADMSHVPPWLLGPLLRASPDVLAATFGEVGLSVIREAKVFVVPLADVAYPGGFLAVGGVGLPAAGGAVGAVTVKGTRAQADDYPAAVARALQKC